jgi:hypothetical protein
MAGHVLTGGCHCGNLLLRLRATRSPAELGARACACTFCAPRRLRWTSDPEGRVEIVVADEGELNRYRFGTETADFLICRRCGQVVAAVSDGPEPRAVINVDVLQRAGEFGEAVPRDFDDEEVEAKLARRARSWTPATIRSRDA